MLVLSRRPQEKIVFPQLNVEVEVLGVSGNTVRVGVNAPRDVLVLRNEVAEKDAARAGRPASAQAPVSAKPAAKNPAVKKPLVASQQSAAQPSDGISAARKWIHKIRNHLNTAGLAIQVAQAELAHGDSSDADSKLQLALAQLNLLESTLASGPAPEAGSANGMLAGHIPSSTNSIAVQAEAMPPPADPLEVAVETTSAPSGAKPLALVVEDDENESALLAGVLRLNGFRVETASDGCHALDYLATHKRPDVVLLDMRMPRCDGPTTISKIRSNPQLSGLRVVAVSGYRSSDLGVGTGPQGVDRWFCKPLDPSRLVHELKHDLHVTTGAARPTKSSPR